MMNPAPQTPHFVSPENRYCGRFARRWRPLISSRAGFVSDATSQPSRGRPDTIRSSGTSRASTRLRVEPRHALSGVGILHVAQAIPDQAADVELVVENASSALGVSVDRARTPGPAERTGDAFSIQVLGDLFR